METTFRELMTMDWFIAYAIGLVATFVIVAVVSHLDSPLDRGNGLAMAGMLLAIAAALWPVWVPLWIVGYTTGQVGHALGRLLAGEKVGGRTTVLCWWMFVQVAIVLVTTEVTLALNKPTPAPICSPSCKCCDCDMSDGYTCPGCNPIEASK